MFGSALSPGLRLHILFFDGAFRFGSHKIRVHLKRTATNVATWDGCATLSCVRSTPRSGCMWRRFTSEWNGC